MSKGRHIRFQPSFLVTIAVILIWHVELKGALNVSTIILSFPARLGPTLVTLRRFDFLDQQNRIACYGWTSGGHMGHPKSMLFLLLACSSAQAQINAGDKQPEAGLPFTMTPVASFNLRSEEHTSELQSHSF